MTDAGAAAYSDLAVTNDSQILLLYEAGGYKTLTLARFNLPWLLQGCVDDMTAIEHPRPADRVRRLPLCD